MPHIAGVWRAHPPLLTYKGRRRGRGRAVKGISGDRLASCMKEGGKIFAGERAVTAPLKATSEGATHRGCGDLHANITGTARQN